MSKGQKLVTKLKRRQRSVREATEASVGMDKRPEVMQNSPKAQGLMRGAQRRYDDSFGFNAVGHKPEVEYKVIAALDRFDFDPGPGEDFGMRLVLGEDSGAQPGDSIQILEGALEGRMLEVVSVVNSTTLRLDDVSTFVTPEASVACRVLLSGSKKNYV